MYIEIMLLQSLEISLCGPDTQTHPQYSHVIGWV